MTYHNAKKRPIWAEGKKIPMTNTNKPVFQCQTKPWIRGAVITVLMLLIVIAAWLSFSQWKYIQGYAEGHRAVCREVWKALPQDYKYPIVGMDDNGEQYMYSLQGDEVTKYVLVDCNWTEVDY